MSPIWSSLLTGAVGAGIVTIIGNVIMFKLNRKAVKEDKADAQIEARLDAQEKDTEALKEGVQALLHDRLYQGATQYLKDGKISKSEMSNMEHLYNSYHNLGGNGTGTELFNRIKKLPLELD